MSAGSGSAQRPQLAHRLDGPDAAPVLVLVGSLGTTTDLWNAHVPTLAGFLRVLRYDLRGHGGSEAPAGPYSIAELGGDLVGLLDDLGIERASICGLSIGGMVAMWAAAHRPDRVERLVLACTAPALPPPGAWTKRAAQVRSDGLEGLAGTLFERWFTPGFRRDQPGVLDQVAAMLRSCDPEGYASCCEAIAAMEQWDDLPRIVAPTLVIAGADDPTSPPTTGLRMAEAIPGASLAVLPVAAHLANLAQPERFTNLVLEHVCGSVATRGTATRRAVLGDAHVDRAAAGAGSFGAPFQELITQYAWGEIWSRPGLDRRTRSAVTLAMLVALGRFEELSFHLAAARRNGLSVEEIREVLLQCAVYAGVPAANRAFAVAEALLGERSDSD